MLTALLVMSGIALVLGAVLGFAAIKFKVEGNPLVDQIDAILPQTQCGQCSFPGCKPYATAIAEGRADINQCPPGGEEGIRKLAELLGVEAKPLNAENGTVNFLDPSDHHIVGTMTFKNIENVIPCFTPGTLIATPRGEVAVENLRVGDRIITRDNGIQEIRWVGRKDVSGRDLVATPHLKPIMIRAGALGNGLPERDMLVSPNHRILVSNDRTQLYFEESEVLAAAKHLIGSEGIYELDVMQTSYIHFMFDRHEVVLSNGAWTESFQPGDQSLKGIGNSQRNEIYELFPELATSAGIEGYQSARKSLKKHEARLLVK